MGLPGQLLSPVEVPPHHDSLLVLQHLLMSSTAHTAGGALIPQGLLQGQLLAMLLCILVSLGATWLIALFVAKTIGLRPTEEEEAQGLDIADHGEEGYNHN